ncbi:hypothetical protein HN385_00680 [archaeon]|jgi:hypothetical protein|nr:hypothetical protein [archaeon]MBT3450936.1 hypothetical protein [archaeon]MBT6869582.1 hypothetical protein [archaeon]MBT7193426.1 hypothetical protein [archaeon]MBT7381017.1 hypothetical protein [archaeon]
MTNDKFEKYENLISGQENLEEKALIISEIDDLLEPYKKQMFVQLEFNEKSQREQIAFGITDEGDEFSGMRLYSYGVKIAIGVYQEMKYSGKKFDITNKEVKLETGFMDSLSKPFWMEKLPIYSQLIQKDDSLLVWNKNLPVFYTNKSEFDESKHSFTPGRVYAPHSLPSNGLDSVAIVLGTGVIAKMFGLEKSEGINNTETLFQAILVQNGIDASLITEVIKEDYKLKGNLYEPVRELVEKIPKKFFRESIFAYDIEKPEGYNMTWKERTKLGR